MPKLLSRQRFVPNGFKFWIPAIKFQAAPNASFDSIVQSIISARKANPHLAAKHGWATDYETVANELDFYNAKMCQDLGYTDYITDSGGGATAPFTAARRSLSSKLQSVAAGSKTLVEWIASGAEAVPAEQANQRAAVCAACPLNEKGDLSRWFTVPVSEAIRAALSDRQAMNLSTPFDEQLSICGACSCPLKLKVHVPLASILPRLPQEARDSLDKGCWITAEVAAK